MSLAIRQIYEKMPPILSIPTSIQQKRVEVILLPLDDVEPMPSSKEMTATVDEYNWPVGLFEKLTSSWQGEPMERGEQEALTVRLELK